MPINPLGSSKPHGEVDGLNWKINETKSTKEGFEAKVTVNGEEYIVSYGKELSGKLSGQMDKIAQLIDELKLGKPEGVDSFSLAGDNLENLHTIIDNKLISDFPQALKREVKDLTDERNDIEANDPRYKELGEKIEDKLGQIERLERILGATQRALKGVGDAFSKVQAEEPSPHQTSDPERANALKGNAPLENAPAKPPKPESLKNVTIGLPTKSATKTTGELGPAFIVQSANSNSDEAKSLKNRGSVKANDLIQEFSEHLNNLPTEPSTSNELVPDASAYTKPPGPGQNSNDSVYIELAVSDNPKINEGQYEKGDLGSDSHYDVAPSLESITDTEQGGYDIVPSGTEAVPQMGGAYQSLPIGEIREGELNRILGKGVTHTKENIQNKINELKGDINHYESAVNDEKNKLSEILESPEALDPNKREELEILKGKSSDRVEAQQAFIQQSKIDIALLESFLSEENG